MTEFFEGIIRILSYLLNIAFWVGVALIVLFVILFIVSLFVGPFVVQLLF